MSKLQSKLFHSFMAGCYIAFSGMTYLIIPDKTIGSMFFAMGIFLVTNFSNMLFTRVIPLSACGEYSFWDALISWIGNGLGTFFIATLAHFTRFEAKILERLDPLVHEKLTDTPVSLIIMGCFCAVFVSYSVFAVNKTQKGSFIQIFLVWILITAFVFGGYDHIVANFYYLSAHSWAYGIDHIQDTIKVILCVTCGNVIGGLTCGFAERYYVHKHRS